MILTGEKSEIERPPPAEPESSTLTSAYRVFGLLAAIGGIVAIFAGVLNHDISPAIAGGVSLIAAILLFGLSEFFQQVTRITTATEEIVRLLRERNKSP